MFFVEARTSLAFQRRSTCWSETLPSFVLVRQLIFLGFVFFLITHNNFGVWYFPGAEYDHRQSFPWKKIWTLRKSLWFSVVQFLFVWGFVWVCFIVCFLNSFPSLSSVMQNKNLIFPSWMVRLLSNSEGFAKAKKRTFVPRAVAPHIEFSICASVLYYPLLPEI